MNKETLLLTFGDFSWDFGMKYFIETSQGNFIWSDPDYGGDNSIKSFNGSLNDFMSQNNLILVRDKGKHLIVNYCGSNFKFIV